MIKYRIITDSSCGITVQEGEKLNVTILPLTLLYMGKEYKDGIDIKTDDFYKLLFSKEGQMDFPKTSMVSPLEFSKIYEECLAKGEIPIVLPISSSLSATYQSACIAKEAFGDKEIYVIDTKTALGALKVLILALTSKSFNTITDLLDEINYLLQHIRFYAVPLTLQYLYRGGRLSKTSALLGNLLNLKPILTVDNNTGKVLPLAKVRGIKHAYLKINDFIKENPIDFNYPLDFGYSSDIKNVNELKSYLSDDITIYTMTQISPVVGAHVGPNACAIFYICKK